MALEFRYASFGEYPRITLAAQKQHLLMVGHLLWYHPAVLKLKALVEEGALGRIRYIYSTRPNSCLREAVSVQADHAPQPSAGILDNRAVKTTGVGVSGAMTAPRSSVGASATRWWTPKGWSCGLSYRGRGAG
jgi:hypothetical protein